MKRADALQPLSRDHLKALLAAKRVLEAPDATTAGSAFSTFWEAEREHFRLEEEILLPHWAASAGPVQESAAATARAARRRYMTTNSSLTFGAC